MHPDYRPEIPEQLFKYLPPPRIDVLENLKIRYTQARALNDPFESLPGILLEDKQWYRQRHKEIIEEEVAQSNFRSNRERKDYIAERKKQFQKFL